MDYKLNLSEKVKLSDNVKISLFKKAKIYYKKRPFILILNIILTIVGAFLNPIIGVLIGLVAIFVLPSWREKEVR